MPVGRTAFARLADAPLHLDGFEGPLELLLHLLERRELEITSVALAAVADQYLAYLRLLPPETLRLDFLAEFLVVASQLLLLKSRVLLPREAARATEDETVLDEAALEARLAEYRRYRAAAACLREREEQGVRAFARQGSPPLPPRTPPPRLEPAAPEHLARALARLLAMRPPPSEPARPPRVTLAERVEEVRSAVAAQGQVRFSELVAGAQSRSDLVITFLAILELFRTRQLDLRQDTLFGEIWLLAR